MILRFPDRTRRSRTMVRTMVSPSFARPTSHVTSTTVESPNTPVTTPILEVYLDLIEVIIKTEASSLPPHRPYDCATALLPSIPTHYPSEQQAIKNYIQEVCEFYVSKISFLGYIICQEGVNDWPTPKTIKELQCFPSFANFYRRFIQVFSPIVSPITTVLKKYIPG